MTNTTEPTTVTRAIGLSQETWSALSSQLEGEIHVYRGERPEIESSENLSYDDLCLSVAEARELAGQLLLTAHELDQA